MSLLSFHSVPIRRLCTRTIVTGYLSQQTHNGVPRVSSLDPPDQGSFEAAGIQPAIAASLRVAFPNVQKPTAMQRKLIRGITGNRNILLQDDTGTGNWVGRSIEYIRADHTYKFSRSFAAMLALLSKPPVQLEKANSGGLTGLLIVPHRDLAYRYLHWIHHMTLPEGDAPISLTKKRASARSTGQ